MFRSWSEFTTCAEQLFDLFAEQPPPSQNSVDGYLGYASSPSTVAGSSAGRILTRAGIECAFFVLFGVAPSSSLISACFALESSATPLLSTTTTTVASEVLPMPSGSCSAAAERRSVMATREEFLRFIGHCAAEESGYIEEEEESGNGSFSLGAATDWMYQWPLFESMAGPKGYITWEDIIAHNCETPFQCVAQMVPPRDLNFRSASITGASVAEPVTRPGWRAALLQHIFWVLDGDRDGRIRFEDVKKFFRKEINC